MTGAPESASTEAAAHAREEAERAEFLRDALAGLSGEPKTIPGKYLWDARGSDLFDRICGTADYYPTRQEMALLPRAAAEAVAAIGPGATVVEFGAGASRKIRVLLDALERPEAYIALDISGAYLEAAVARLAPDYPGVAMTPFCADYTRPVRLPVDLAGRPVLGFYPGTSIGNFAPDEAERFMARARETLGPSLFLIGTDATQDPERLRRAYGGADGLMAAFHGNLLHRLRRDLGAELDPDAFAHTLRIGGDPLRVEAHLAARDPTTIRLGDTRIAFAAGESLRTDLSHKYAPEAFRALAVRAGWTPVATVAEAGGSFCLHLLRTGPARD
ncbi:L-histidine N(alpha)-methyltransferase [Methylobacterium sp. NEAU 140]|nr:L-histidine N(alpha)-methyltransferase [Methylobacterium sp. NEAU 140]MDP4022544.1 L-histidine N(alpha)-methyltransferase [Methylobacterium sp. NEAU 140]